MLIPVQPHSEHKYSFERIEELKNMDWSARKQELILEAQSEKAKQVVEANFDYEGIVDWTKYKWIIEFDEFNSKLYLTKLAKSLVGRRENWWLPVKRIAI